MTVPSCVLIHEVAGSGRRGLQLKQRERFVKNIVALNVAYFQTNIETQHQDIEIMNV